LKKAPSVILIDDKYQSGMTIQFVASRLYDAGTAKVYGLCAVKTLRDMDNQ
jgi:predicted amidophosphoribosyltransferase